MTSSLWISVLIVAGVVVLLFFRSWAARPSPIPLKSPSAVRDALGILLSNGTKGARLRFQLVREQGVRLDVVKYIIAHGNVGLCMVVEKTPKMDAVYDRLAQTIARSVQSSELRQVSNGRERTQADLGTDVARIERIARNAFEEGLRLSLANDVVGYYDLVLLKNQPRLTGVGPR